MKFKPSSATRSFVRGNFKSFTLIELLVVIAIIAVMASLGIAAFRVLGRTSELEAQRRALRSILRRARNSAREERYGAEVIIQPETGIVRCKSRQSLAFFRLESAISSGPAPENGAEPAATPETPEEPVDPEQPVTITGAFNMLGKLYNAQPVLGKVGTAFLFSESDDMLNISPGHIEVEHEPRLSPAEGIHIEAWIQPGQLEKTLSQDSGDGYGRRIPERTEQDEPAYPSPARSYKVEGKNIPAFTIVRKGKAYELALLADYSLELTVSGFDDADQEVTYSAISRPEVVQARKWSHVAVAFDGNSVKLFINGIERIIVPKVETETAMPVRLLVDTAPLRISDNSPRRCFYGVIDEVKISGLIRGAELKIPPSITVLPSETHIYYDASGNLDRLRHGRPIQIDLCDFQDFDMQLFGKSYEERSEGTVERGSEQEAALLNKAQRHAQLVQKGQRLLSTIPEANKKRVIVDLYGTLR